MRAVRASLARDWQLYAIIALPIAWFVVFRYLPMYGAQIAFRDFLASKGIWGSDWVGLDNLRRFFVSYMFGTTMRNTLGISLYSLVAGFPVPVLLALALNSMVSRRFKKAVQLVIYAPYFISTVVMVGMIIQFLSPTIGVLGNLYRLVGRQPVSLLGSSWNFWTIFVVSGIWQGAGWGTVIYMATLAGISPELHEAAIIDGASKIQRTWYIDLPGIMPTIITLLILTMGQVMNLGFEKVFLMQNALNLNASEVIATYVYKIGLSGLPKYSYAAAIGLFNAAINFVLIVAMNAAAKRATGQGLW
jgi:putative aldouronate transport system permease protein